MTVIDTLIERNALFAAHHHNPNMLMGTALGITVIGCLDPRVDPAYVLGLQQGDAAVIRNVGGRVTPATLQTLSLIGTLPAKLGAPAGAQGMHIVVLQHTNCGITRMAQAPDELAAYFGVAPDHLDAKTVLDPYAAVRVDVAVLREKSDLPDGSIVTGIVYDVASGRIEVVVPTAPVHATTLGA